MASQNPDTDLASSGYVTIVASMIVFVVLLLAIWALMGLQIHLLRRKHLADLENDGVRVGPVDYDTPLDNILKGKGKARASESSREKWSPTQPSTNDSTNASSKSDMPYDSQWYREERPVRYFFHKIGNTFKRKDVKSQASETAPTTPRPTSGDTLPQFCDASSVASSTF
ncbi:hypothetical protein NUW58_g9789 [Xylaria curta]|uniref:Uncharacterized protein n=1 Tax=Xylaria curta TaxID=42375 RepID=A0ACC1MUE2_9PEZI|nr:hypothetical protein NUW58_g9789 [Xylaria curta]